MQQQHFPATTEALMHACTLARLNEGGTFILEFPQPPGRAPHFGGATLIQPQAGFVVGGAAYSRVQAQPFEVHEVRAYLRSLDGPEERRYTYAFGIWKDSQTGKWWLDAVTVIPLPMDGPEDDVVKREVHARAGALTVAKRRGELAIWSLHEGKEYRVLPKR